MKTKLEIKEWLDNKGTIDYRGNDHMGMAFKSKLTNMYCYQFNAIIIFSYKTFSVFIDTVNRYNERQKLEMEEF